MNTILLAYRDIDVVLGGDAVVLGALRSAGKDRRDPFLGGIDGKPEAVAEIMQGNSPYKASIPLNSPRFGYSMGQSATGQSAADWLGGKSLPQTMDILPIAITRENVAQYQADLVDPAAVFADQTRRDSYLTMYGNICYDSRDQYINLPWLSEGP